ncbi:uncharacterized protein LOC134255369 [Saccostrea cucullata]|uniref:uncharacterized protein LOC134255369 n=1 Tax=Saccostrea cuccullata TaxID=36930 RepID=UPI002ED59B8B
MDPSSSAQDVIRCDLCETAIVQMYCDFCHVSLCKPCIGEHIADEYDKHKIVPFQQRKSTLIYPQCNTHETKTCKFDCKKCNTYVCSLCITSDTHKGHAIRTLSDIFNSKKEIIGKDTEELEKIISPTYEEIATDIETQIANLDEEYENLLTAVTEHGEEWHKKIDNIVNKMKTEIEEIKIKHICILKKHLGGIKQIQNLIKQTLLKLYKIDESNEVSMIMEYSSKIKDLSRIPPKVEISLPTFNPKSKDTEYFYTLFGSLTQLSTKTKENGYKLKKQETPTRELLEEPELITSIDTGYEELRSVACLSEEEIWTSGMVSDMKCFNIQGSLIKTIRTKSGERPSDITVASDGDLLYSDRIERTVNRVKNGQTEEMIRLQDWTPRKLCVTSSGDLLVTMYSVTNLLVSIFSKPQFKVVRFSGSTEKQTIQFDEEGKPLYSGNDRVKYISENRNLDICVADCEAGAVVVVNQAGKLRFRYTGHPPSAIKKKQFVPYGITTDSQSQILTADYYNHCIHILDQDGQFLRYIDNCDLKNPYGLCVDKNNLFVTEWNLDMDPSSSAQDVIRCDLCETAIVQMYCDFCHVNLCKPCIGEHIADDYNKHQIVPFQQRKSTLIYSKCTTHETERCKFQCKECNTSVCSLCIITDTHKGHTISTLFDIFNSKRELIGKDIEELENIISPTYEEIATDIETQIANLDGEYDRLSTEVTEHGEEWHKEIDNIVNKMKTEIEEIKNKHMTILKKHLDEIKEVQSVIEKTLLKQNEINESNEVSMTVEYSSKIKDFRKLPPKVIVSLPLFSPKSKDTEQLYALFGSLTPISTKTEENGYKLKKPPRRELLKEPELITSIETGYKELRSVTCLSEEEIWTCGQVSDMKCFSMQGSLIKTIKTKTGEHAVDIAVTNDGDLVYSDWERRIVNKVKNGQIEEMITLQDWKPNNLCVTSSGELLVTMFSDDQKHSKVVRYSGSIEKQTIQFDEEDKPLYSGNGYIKYISAVVVCNQAGEFRFRYTGHPSSTKNGPFKPRGITTDSQSQILTADRINHCIHILDQDGQFLRYIDNCDLKEPFGLCVDKKDNLLVAEYRGNVKKIKYLL